MREAVAHPANTLMKSGFANGDRSPARVRSDVRPRALIVSLASLLVFIVPACGNDSSLARDDVTKVLDQARSRGSARWSMEFSFLSAPPESGAPKSQITWSGVIDFRRRVGKSTFTLGATSTTTTDVDCDLVNDGDVVYVKLAGEETWGRTESSKLPAPNPQSLADTDNSLDAMLRNANSVRRVERDDIRGTSADKYVISIDKDAYAREFKTTGKGVELPDLDVWVDGDGLPRRFSVMYGDANAPSSSWTMDLFDFGVRIDVTPPTNVSASARGGLRKCFGLH